MNAGKIIEQAMAGLLCIVTTLFAVATSPVWVPAWVIGAIVTRKGAAQ